MLANFISLGHGYFCNFIKVASIRLVMQCIKKNEGWFKLSNNKLLFITNRRKILLSKAKSSNDATIFLKR